MKSIYYRDNLMPQNESTVVGEGLLCGSKRRRGFKEVPSSEILGEGLKVGDEVAGGGPVAAPLSNSGLFEASVNSTDDHIGSTVGILVGGGELCEEGEISGPARLSHGSISVIGRRRVMEDAVTIVPGIVGGEFSFFAVYDGHGGSRVANACRDRLHPLLVNELKDWKLGIDWEKVMMACFAKMDEEVSCSSGADVDVESTSLKMEGSTAVVVVVGKEELVVANCGDSRAVLGRGGVAVPLSRDHKPDRPDEKERVEAIGGRVINWNGSRVQGVLATSRSIGDHFLRPYVISEPEVTVNRRTELDSFLIIASDGLWDVVSNEIACDVVRRCLEGKIGKAFLEGSAAAGAAGLLAELAIAKGSKDNISVIVVELKPLH